MYTRTVEGKELELRVSGKLYKDALVMFDRETGTLWTQVDGAALRGPLAGNRLVAVPAMQTTWNVWKRLHPDTVVLRKSASISRSTYGAYAMDPSRRGLFGTEGDPRLTGKSIVVGVDSDREAVAVTLHDLRKHQVVAFELNGQPIVAFFSRSDSTAAVFRPLVDGRRLTFRARAAGRETLIEDAETRSTWAPLEGRALRGPLAGKQLERVPSLQSYWYAWSAYRPHTRIVP